MLCCCTVLIVNLDQSKFDRVHTNLQHHTNVKDLYNIFFYLRRYNDRAFSQTDYRLGLCRWLEKTKQMPLPLLKLCQNNNLKTFLLIVIKYQNITFLIVYIADNVERK